MNNTVVFNNNNIELIEHNNQAYMTLSQIASALEFKHSSQVNDVFSRHADEFDEEMSCLIKKGRTRVRIFNREGAWLIGMFARTPVAADFRKWVLKVLGQTENQNSTVVPVREHTRRPPSGKKEVVLSEKEHKAIGGIVKSCVQSALKEVTPVSGLSGRERNLLEILRACGYDMKANDASWEDTFSGLDGFIIQGHYERMAIMAMRAAVAQEMLKTASEAEKPKYLAIRNENLKRIHRQSVVNEAGLHCIA